MLLVGHNCPGCGLDTPSIACEACGAPVVWDREHGSHCSACNRSAASFACPECGLRAELDKHASEPVTHAAAVSPPAQDEAEAADEIELPPALLARFGTSLASTPLARTLAIGMAVGLHGLVIAVVIGGAGGAQPAPRGDVAIARVVAAPVPDYLARGAVKLPLDAQPVPLPPLPPGAEPPPPLPEPRLALSPPSATVSRVDTSPPSVPRNESWLKRVLRSGRAYSPASDHFPADRPGIGR